MNHSNNQFSSQLSEIGRGFTLDEAVQLLHREVMQKHEKNNPQSVKNIGVISGLLTLHDEIELVVKFLDRIEPYTKAEFSASLTTIV